MTNEQIMNVYRYETGTTSQNSIDLGELISKPNWIVRLYASPKMGTDEDQKLSGPSSNYPLLVALATEKLVTGIYQNVVLMDGIFLTAQRGPRASEIMYVLDVAMKQHQGKVLVSYGDENARAPFTAGLDKVGAVKKLFEIPSEPLTATNRARFWGMLSSVTEDQFKQF